MKRLGIIAGEGSLPRTLSINAMKEGYETIAIAINLKSFIDLQGHYTEGKLLPLTQTAKCIQYLQSKEVSELVFIGKVHKLWAISQIPFLDGLGRRYLQRLINLQDNTVHDLLVQICSESGFQIIPQITFLQNLLAPKQNFTNRPLTKAEEQDIEFGFEMAKRAAELEVSQLVVVKDRSVMAFEAAEGTDKTIERGCRLARKGGVVIKVAWKNQLEQFDLPTIGPRTIQTIAKHKGTVLAIQANSTFIAEPERTIKLAKEKNIAFMAI